jgi:Ca-activated chloride channel family protein
MSFIWPLMLLSLLTVPLLGVVYLTMQRRRRRLAESFAGREYVRGDSPVSRDIRRHIPIAFLLVGLTILFIGLARPQTVVNVPKREGIVILAFDSSGSMAADDLKPTRIEAAKAAARDFVQRQPATIQIGVVAFSESGFAVQPATSNTEQILASINRLKPERGTSLAAGIIASLNAIAVNMGVAPQFESSPTPAPAVTPTPFPEDLFKSAIIVMLTDGENTAPPDPISAAQTAADLGVQIYTIGIGSSTGTTLDINGFTVHTQLDEAALQQISEITGGVYYNAQTEQDLNAIYEKITPQFVIKEEKMEVTSILAGASLFFLMIGGAFSLVWFGRLP